MSDGRPGYLMFGPYVQVAPGPYQARVQISGSQVASGTCLLEVACDAGNTVLASVDVQLHAGLGEMSLPFTAARLIDDFEVRVRGAGSTVVALSGMSLVRQVPVGT